ncbi:MAG TPA: M50 family metallopeptidase [Fimbriimonas sp.]|nr:M50 family metallopeptidase [Fimbriimonas sp.]
MAWQNIPSYALVALVFVLMLSILVAAHELGHYLFARLFRMGVEEFAIGFGKKPIWTWMRKTYKVEDDHHPGVEATETTDFTIRAWPLGGFVRIKGMVPEEDGSEVDIPGGFYNKSPFHRFVVLLAGPAFSVIAGILVLIPLYATVGIDRLDNTPIVPKMAADGPAAKAGLLEGDRILAINDKPVTTFYDVIVDVRDSAGKPLVMSVDRKGEKLEITAIPEWAPMDMQVRDRNLDPTGEWKRQALLGFSLPEPKLVKLPLGEAIGAAVNEPVRAVRGMVSLMTRPKNFERTVSGPATMVAFTSYALEKGVATVLKLSALLSISVGIFNLLPFAPLDGGQMVVAVIEMFRRGRRLSLQMQTALSAVGMTLIAMLVLGAWFVDFKRWIVPEKQEAPVPSKTK